MVGLENQGNDHYTIVAYGWGGWIRTNEMLESKSSALPLGDTPSDEFQ